MNCKIKNKNKNLSSKNNKSSIRNSFKIILITILLIGLFTKTYSWLYEEYVGSGITMNMGEISHIVTHYDNNGTLIADDAETQTIIYEKNLSNVTKSSKYIKIENNGSLDLEYNLNMSYEGTLSSVGILYYRLYEITEQVNVAGSLEAYATNNPLPSNIETDSVNPVKNMTLINNEEIRGTIELDPASTTSAVYYRLDYGMYQSVNTSLYSKDSMSLHLNVYSTQVGAFDDSNISGQIWQVSNENQLREILLSATNGDTIQLIDNFKVDGTLNIGKRINLDTNNHTLTVTGDLVYDFANLGELLIDVSGDGRIVVDNNLYINTPKAEVDIIGNKKNYDIVVGGTTTFNGIQNGEKDGIYLEKVNIVKSSGTLIPVDVIVRANTRLTVGPEVNLGVVTAENGSTNIEVINNGNITQLNFSNMNLLKTFTKAQIYVYNLGNIYGIVGSTGIVLPSTSTPYLGPNNGNTWIIKGITSNDITVSGSDNFNKGDIDSNLDDVYVMPIEGEENAYTVYIKDSVSSVESLLTDYFINEGYNRPDEPIKEIRKLVIWTLNAQYFENEDFDFLKSNKIPYIEHLNLYNSRIIDNGTVNRIKDDALNGKSSLKTLILPPTLNEIGNNAFYNIELGKIPNNIKDEFYFMTIPSSVSSIGENAFNATEFVYFESNNPPTININSFNKDLIRVFVNPGAIDDYLNSDSFNNKQIYQKGELSDDRKYIVFEYNEGLGISYVVNNVVSTSTLGIPTTITYRGSNKKVLVIGTNSYRHMNIYPQTGTAVILPSSVIRIDKYAFTDLNINNIVLTNVQEVKDFAFANTNIDMLNAPKLRIIGSHAFENTKIKELSLASIETIGAYAFNNVETMYSAYLYNVSDIGAYAFNNCKYLNKVYFTNTDAILVNNSEEINIKLGENSTFSNWGFYTDGRLRVYVPDGKTAKGNTYLSLYQKLFNGNENYIFVTGNEIGIYKHMALPYDINVYTVREVTVNNKTGWEIVSYQGEDLGNDYTIPESLTYNGVTKDVISIGEYAYRNVLFKENSSISINNNSLLKIGNHGLSNMNIININTPNVTEIGNYALYGTSLKTAKFSNLKILGDYALAELLTLNMVDLGTVENIGYAALFNDANLEQIFINNTKYTIVLENKAFYNVGLNAGKRLRIYVPSSIESLNYYKTLLVDFENYIYEKGILVGSYVNAPIMYDISEYSVKEVTLKDRDGIEKTGYELIEYHGADLSNSFVLPENISIEPSNVTISTVKTNEWTTQNLHNYEYNIVLNNNTDKEIVNWKFKVDTYNMNITGIWNVKREDFTNYSIISNSNANNPIPANGKLNIQIQFNTTIADYKLNASFIDENNSGLPLISIGEKAFYNVDSQANTNIKLNNNNLINIGNYAFYNIKGIKELDLLNLTYLGDYAFYNSELNRVNLPNLKSIGSFALSNMPTLYYINLGRVIEMKENSLYNLNNLLQVYFKPTNETIVFDANAINNVGSLTENRIRFYVDKVSTVTEEETTEKINLNITSKRNSRRYSRGKYTIKMTGTISNPSNKDISSWSVNMNLGNATLKEITSGAISTVNGTTAVIKSDGSTSTIPAQGSKNFTYTVITPTREWAPTFDTPIGLNVRTELFEENIEFVNTYKNSFKEEYKNYFYTKGEIIGTFTPANIPFEIGEYTVNSIRYKDTKGVSHNGWELVEYHGPDISSQFEIPETIDVKGVNMPLISIGEYAFRWAKFNTNETIDLNNSGLLLIDNYAFYNMNINNLDIPNVDFVGDYAFYNNKLSIANMPNLNTLGNYALANNNLLNYVNLGNVEKIGAHALENDTALEQMLFTSTNVDVSTVKMNMVVGENAFYNSAIEIGKRFRIYVPDGNISSTSTYKDAYKNTLPANLSQYIYETGILINDYRYSVLPYNIHEYSVKEVNINNTAGYKIIEYHGPDITSNFSIPTSVTIDGEAKPIISIGDGAFVGVEAATNETWDLVIPTGIMEIGKRAFYKTPIYSVYSDATLESIGEEAFSEMPNLTNVNLGTVKYINRRAFYLDKKLTTVRLGTGVLAIGSQAFYNTYDENKMSKFYIATEVPPTIEADTFPPGRQIFIWTVFNTDFYVPRQSVTDYENAPYWSERVGYIHSSAELYNNTYYYSKNDNTKEVNIVEYIGNSWDTLTIPDTFNINNVNYKVTSIDGSAFDSANFTTLVLPQYLTSIGKGFLDNNNSIINIEVNPNNTLFSSVNGVLYDGNIETLIRYPRARTVDNYTLDNRTKVLANGSFVNSSSIVTLNFNQELLAIGTGVFDGMTSLTTMNFTSVKPPYLMGFGSFPTNYNLIINFPRGSAAAYNNNLFYNSYRNYLREN